MQTLSYATPRDLKYSTGLRAGLWRHRIACCFMLSLMSGPWCVKWLLDAGFAVAGIAGPVTGPLLLAVAAAAQGLVLLLWMAIAIGLLFEDRALTDAEEALMPLTLIVLTSWGVADMLAAAILSTGQIL